MKRHVEADPDEIPACEPRDVVLLSERARKLLHYEWVRRQTEALAITA